MSKRITVFGGDIRQITVAECFAKEGYDVSVYGFDKDVIPQSLTLSETLAEALKDSHILILGITPCKENMNMSTPCWRDVISAETLLTHLTSNHTVIGGKLPESFLRLCALKNVKCIDYAEREDFAVLNAVPSAEGAISIAMHELPVTIHDCKCLVAGFGRIGKILARNLNSLGAKVTCSARKSQDLAWIDSLGYKSVHTDNLISCVHDIPVIFNTVPEHIFNHEILRNICPGTLIIDLASNPGGVDLLSAETLGIKVIWALSLPGKTSPVTSGKIIKDTVANILSEL